MKRNSLLHKMDSLFTAKESSFIAWFSVFFLGTAVLLAGFGLLPSEFQEQSEGTSFVQSAENSVKQYIQGGTTGGTDATSNGSSNQNGNQIQGANQGGGYQGFFSSILGNTPRYVSSGGNTTANGSATGRTNTQVGTTPSNTIPKGIVPDTLVIPSLSLETVIRNPTSADIDDLDFELTKGAVRYPGSGTIGNGNMFIFGHSTGYKIVLNKAYKVFNDLKLLGKGDQILLKSGVKTYAYEVTSVQKVNKNTTEIVFDQSSSMLTLSTCDSFGATTDRYVVEAVFKGER